MALERSSDFEVRHFVQDFNKSLPFVNFQYLDVTFGSADTDMDIKHNLNPKNPEDVRYLVVNADRATQIFNDQSASRKPWGQGYVILQSSTANAVVRLLLFVERV